MRSEKARFLTCTIYTFNHCHDKKKKEAAAIEVKKRTENTGGKERVSKKKLGLDIAPYLIMVLPFDVKVSTICFNKRLSYTA